MALVSTNTRTQANAVTGMCWRLMFATSCYYCSDVSGAFDRVRRQRLCNKLSASGLPSDVVNFLASWLEDRISNVIVSGALSFIVLCLQTMCSKGRCWVPLCGICFMQTPAVLLGSTFSRKQFSLTTTIAGQFSKRVLTNQRSA